MKARQVPFFRPELREEEVNEVVATLRSGWLTSGPKVKRFESEFASVLGSNRDEQAAKAKGKSLHAVALNSGTAALHLAVEALGAVRLDHPQVHVGGVGVPRNRDAQVALRLRRRTRSMTTDCT